MIASAPSKRRGVEVVSWSAWSEESRRGRKTLAIGAFQLPVLKSAASSKRTVSRAVIESGAPAANTCSGVRDCGSAGLNQET